MGGAHPGGDRGLAVGRRGVAGGTGRRPGGRARRCGGPRGRPGRLDLPRGTTARDPTAADRGPDAPAGRGVRRRRRPRARGRGGPGGGRGGDHQRVDPPLVARRLPAGPGAGPRRPAGRRPRPPRGRERRRREPALRRGGDPGEGPGRAGGRPLRPRRPGVAVHLCRAAGPVAGLHRATATGDPDRQARGPGAADRAARRGRPRRGVRRGRCAGAGQPHRDLWHGRHRGPGLRSAGPDLGRGRALRGARGDRGRVPARGAGAGR